MLGKTSIATPIQPSKRKSPPSALMVQRDKKISRPQKDIKNPQESINFCLMGACH